MNIWFDQFCQIFVKLFAKNMKSWSVKHEILCAEQSDRAEKKVESYFLAVQLFMVQISAKYLFTYFIIEKYLESFSQLYLTGPQKPIHILPITCWNCNSFL